jgi:hypothetical protein
MKLKTTTLGGTASDVIVAKVAVSGMNYDPNNKQALRSEAKHGLMLMTQVPF